MNPILAAASGMASRGLEKFHIYRMLWVSGGELDRILNR